MSSPQALLTFLLLAALVPTARDLCPLAERTRSQERIVVVDSRLVAQRGQRLLPGVEDITDYCLSCHDGTVAAGVFLRGQAQRVSEVSPHTSHPVDVPYPRGRTGYRNRVEIDSRISLPAGQVTCLSCHGGDESSRDFLSVSLRGSRLCLECHAK